MEIRRYLSVVRRRIVVVVTIVVVVLVAAWWLTPRDDAFTATSTMYVGSRSIDADPASAEISGDLALASDRLISTFNRLITSDPVVEDAVERAEVARSADEVVHEIHAEQLPNTNLIRVSVSDPDPVVAQVLANAMAESFVEQMREFEPRDPVDAEASEVISVYERARLPTTADPGSLLRNLALGGIVGILLAAALVALLEHLDITIRSSDDVERVLELPVLGLVPALGGALPAGPANVQERRPRVSWTLQSRS